MKIALPSSPPTSTGRLGAHRGRALRTTTSLGWRRGVGNPKWKRVSRSRAGITSWEQPWEAEHGGVNSSGGERAARERRGRARLWGRVRAERILSFSLPGFLPFRSFFPPCAMVIATHCTLWEECRQRRGLSPRTQSSSVGPPGRAALQGVSARRSGLWQRRGQGVRTQTPCGQVSKAGICTLK